MTSEEYLSHLLKGCDLLSKEYCENLGEHLHCKMQGIMIIATSGKFVRKTSMDNS